MRRQLDRALNQPAILAGGALAADAVIERAAGHAAIDVDFDAVEILLKEADVDVAVLREALGGDHPLDHLARLHRTGIGDRRRKTAVRVRGDLQFDLVLRRQYWPPPEPRAHCTRVRCALQRQNIVKSANSSRIAENTIAMFRRLR